MNPDHGENYNEQQFEEYQQENNQMEFDQQQEEGHENETHMIKVNETHETQGAHLDQVS